MPLLQIRKLRYSEGQRGKARRYRRLRKKGARIARGAIRADECALHETRTLACLLLYCV
jgi:hypothetical protein